MLLERVEVEYQPHRQRIRLRVDEPAAPHAFRATEELLGGALPAGEAPALVDLLFGHLIDRPHPESHLLRLEALVQPGLLGQQRKRPVACDHQRSLDDVVRPGHSHAPHRAVRAHQPLGPAAGEQGDPGGHRLLGIPAIELRAEHGKAGQAFVGCRARADRRRVRARSGLESQRGRGACTRDREDALGDRPLPRRPLPEVGDELLGHGTVGHHPAEHVLLPWILAALQQEHFRPRLSQPESRARAGRPGADDDGVEGRSPAGRRATGHRNHRPRARRAMP